MTARRRLPNRGAIAGELVHTGLSAPDDGELVLPVQAERAEPIWPTPVDLWAKFDAPELPANILPPVIERYARGQAMLTGADPAGLAMAALTVCAAAIPDRIKVQPKVHEHGWCEAARIWTALIGPPSTKKSPMIRQAARPLIHIDMNLFNAYLDKKAKYDALSAEERKQTAPPKHVQLRIEDATMESRHARPLRRS